MKPFMIVLAIVVATACGGWYYGIHAHAKNEIQLIQAQSAEERARQSTREEIAGLLAQIERYRERLPSNADPSWLAQEVVELAQQARVQITSITQAPPQSFDKFTFLSVNLQLTASYHQFGAFLDEVERSPHFIRVDRFSVDRSDTDERGSVQVTFSTVVLPRLVQDAAT